MVTHQRGRQRRTKNAVVDVARGRIDQDVCATAAPLRGTSLQGYRPKRPAVRRTQARGAADSSRVALPGASRQQRSGQSTSLLSPAWGRRKLSIGYSWAPAAATWRIPPSCAAGSSAVDGTSSRGRELATVTVTIDATFIITPRRAALPTCAASGVRCAPFVLPADLGQYLGPGRRSRRTYRRRSG